MRRLRPLAVSTVASMSSVSRSPLPLNRVPRAGPSAGRFTRLRSSSPEVPKVPAASTNWTHSMRRDHTDRRIERDQSVLAAGTFGTSGLLLRNRVNLPALGPALGTRFSGNGDLLTLLMEATVDTASGRSRLIDGSYGPVITSAIRVPDTLDGTGREGRGYYIQEAGFPEFTNWLVEAAMVPSTLRRGASMARDIVRHRLKRQNESTISAEVAKLVGQGRVGS